MEVIVVVIVLEQLEEGAYHLAKMVLALVGHENALTDLYNIQRAPSRHCSCLRALEEAVHHDVLVVQVLHLYRKVLEVFLGLRSVEGALGAKHLQQHRCLVCIVLVVLVVVEELYQVPLNSDRSVS